MERVAITEAEIIEALREASNRSRDKEGITTEEIHKETGWSLVRCRKLIKAEIAAGRMQPTKVMRPYMDGRDGLVSGYRWVG